MDGIKPIRPIILIQEGFPHESVVALYDAGYLPVRVLYLENEGQPKLLTPSGRPCEVEDDHGKKERGIFLEWDKGPNGVHALVETVNGRVIWSTTWQFRFIDDVAELILKGAK